MIFSFGDREKFGNVIIAVSGIESHGTGIRAVGLGRRRLQALLEADPKGGVDGFLHRFAQACGDFARFCGNVWIQGQGGAHGGIMMLS